jgi:MinD-like ATPase involved in chromosome partitioning or flagellar assembly
MRAASAEGNNTAVTRGNLDRKTWDFPSEVTRELAVLIDPAAASSRAFTAIASQLQHMYVDAGVRSFCFIGDGKKNGTSVVAANVAAAFALSGQRTMLVEANFASPRSTTMFGLDKSRPGLSDWLAGFGDISAWSAYMQPAYPNLVVLPAGNAIRDGEAALAMELRHLVLELSRMFDVVICDAPAMSDVSGTLAVVSSVERTVVVARANKTRLKTLFGFQDVIKQCGGQIGGTVYVDF